MTMKNRTPSKVPIDLETDNRDRLRAPATLKACHIATGEHSRLIIGPTLISNGRFTARREAFTVSTLLSPEWLRVKDLGLVSFERDAYLRAVLGLGKKDVNFEIVGKEEKLLKELQGIDPKTLRRFRRTNATYMTDWGLYVIFKESPVRGKASIKEIERAKKEPEILGINALWADLFAFNYVWRGLDGPILDNPDLLRVNVFITGKGQLPEDAAFAAFAGGFRTIEEPNSK